MIALSGNTGGSTGPHLHFEIIKAESFAGVFDKKNKLDPKSIKDLQLLLDQKNGKPDNNIYDYGEDLNPLVVTGKKEVKKRVNSNRLDNNSRHTTIPRKLNPGDSGYNGSLSQTKDKVRSFGYDD